MESDDLDVVEADAFREVDEPRLRVFTWKKHLSK